MSLKEEDRNVLVTLELEKVKKTLAEMEVQSISSACSTSNRESSL